MMDFKIKLKEYQEIVNKELEKYIKDKNCYEKILNESVEYSLMAGGKRLRPILVLDTYKLFKDDYENVIPYAIALEMVHNFSLIHDDLPEIDNDDFRHGVPTNHKKFNHATALLAGDALFNQAYIVLSEDLKKEPVQELLVRKIRSFNEFSKAVDRMIAGEYLDTELENKQIEKELLKYIHENKTGALLKLSVRMGAILAGASEEDLEKLSCFADKIGLAFQIKDDILSEEGDEKITGKPVGNDRELNKCTYVSFYGLDGAKKELTKIINEALELLNEYGDKAEFLRGLTIYIRDREK
ncbi:MAG: polyprenyl synthetase family protein [Clostridia bacterium]|nr:polyprenyl synthetase family protein [Clostridia bacterium]